MPMVGVKIVQWWCDDGVTFLCRWCHGGFVGCHDGVEVVCWCGDIVIL